MRPMKNRKGAGLLSEAPSLWVGSRKVAMQNNFSVGFAHDEGNVAHLWVRFRTRNESGERESSHPIQRFFVVFDQERKWTMHESLVDLEIRTVKSLTNSMLGLDNCYLIYVRNIR